MSSPQVKLIPFAGNSSGPSNVCNTFCSSHFAKEMHQHCTFIKATPAAHSRPKNKSGNRVKLVPPAQKKKENVHLGVCKCVVSQLCCCHLACSPPVVIVAVVWVPLSYIYTKKNIIFLYLIKLKSLPMPVRLFCW